VNEAAGIQEIEIGGLLAGSEYDVVNFTFGSVLLGLAGFKRHG